MKKHLLTLPIVIAIALGGLTACTTETTPVAGIPAMIEENSNVAAVNVLQGDAIDGKIGAIYVVKVASSITSEELAATARDTTDMLARNTDASENWGIRFRSGNKEIGMAQSAYLADHPEVIQTVNGVSNATPTPSPLPIEGARDSYAEQVKAIDAVIGQNGILSVGSYDAPEGYFSPSVSDQANFEGAYGVSVAALDQSGWKNRGDFRVTLNLVTQTPEGIVQQTGTSVTANVLIADQNGGISTLLGFPETTVAMYRAALGVPEAVYTTVTIASRGASEDISIKVENPDLIRSVYAAVQSVQTEDSPFVNPTVESTRPHL